MEKGPWRKLLAGGLDSLTEHFDGFDEAAGAGFFLSCLGDPAAVFLAVGEAEGIEGGAEAVCVHQGGEVGGNLDGAVAIVLPDLDFDRVAELLAGLLADGFEEAEHVLQGAAAHEGASVRDAFEGGLNRNSASRAEFLFDCPRGR